MRLGCNDIAGTRGIPDGEDHDFRELAWLTSANALRQQVFPVVANRRPLFPKLL